MMVKKHTQKNYHFYFLITLMCLLGKESFAQSTFVADLVSLSDPENQGKVALVQNDIDLNDGSIVLADNITLAPRGGVISNGTLSNVQQIEDNRSQLFATDVTLFSGSVAEAELYAAVFYPEWYGAQSDGIFDNTAALQASFDNAEFIRLQSNGHYSLEGVVHVDRSGLVRLDGNHATFVSNNLSTLEMFIFDQSLRVTRIRDLTVDGQHNRAKAFNIRTSFYFKEVKVINLFSDQTQVYAFFVDVEKQLTTSIFEECECDTLDGSANGNLFDNVGAARCFQVHWDYLSQPTVIEVNGGTFKNVWGEDGDVIQIASNAHEYDHDSKFIVRDAYLGFASRRIIKGTASGIELYNNFIEAAVDHPQLVGRVPAGMVVFALFDPDMSPNAQLQGIRVIGNTFHSERGTNGEFGDTQVNFSDVDGALIESNQFVSSKVILKGLSGDTRFDDNAFTMNAKMSLDYDSTGSVIIENNTVTHEPGSLYDFRGWIEDSVAPRIIDSLTIQNNILTLNTGIDDLTFGLLWIDNDASDDRPNGSVYSNLLIDGNMIHRNGDYEDTNMLRIDVEIDSTSSIINNIMYSPRFFHDSINLNENDGNEPVVQNNLHRHEGVEQLYDPL